MTRNYAVPTGCVLALLFCSRPSHADEASLRAAAKLFPAMPRGSQDMVPFTGGLPTFASSTPFSDLQYSLLNTDYIDGENSGYDVFLPIDPSDPVPGADQVRLIRCALNTDLDFLYRGSRGDRIILGTGDAPAPYFLRGADAVDNDYAVILHFDYTRGHIQLAGSASDYGLVYCTTNEGSATTGWFLFYTRAPAPDLVAFIFPCHDFEPAVSGNPPTYTNHYCNADHRLSLTDANQFRYASTLPDEPAVPGGLAQFGTPGKDIVGAVCMDAASNVYVVGYTDGSLTNANPAADELFVVKLSPTGRRLWASELPMKSGSVLQAATTDDTHLYAAGRTLGALPGFTNAGRWDGILLKVRLSDGTIVAMDQWGNPGIDGYGNIVLDDAGHLFVSAQGAPPGPAENDDAYLVAKHRTCDLGNVWRVIDPINTTGFAASAEAWGGLSYMPGATPGDGRLLAAGWYMSRNSADAFLAVYEGLTNTVPMRVYDLNLPSQNYRPEWFTANALAPDGRLYLAGATTGRLGAGRAGEADAFVMRIDRDFTNPIIRQFGTPQGDTAWGLHLDPATNVYVTGYTHGDYAGTNQDPNHLTADVFVQVFDADLNPLRARQFGTRGDDRARSAMNHGMLVLAGTTEGAMVSTNHGSFDAYALALDPETLELAPALPPTPSLALAIVHDPTHATPALAWPAIPGTAYTLQATTNLLTAPWFPLATNLTPAFGTRSLDAVLPPELTATHPQLFFKANTTPQAAGVGPDVKRQ